MKILKWAHDFGTGKQAFGESVSESLKYFEETVNRSILSFDKTVSEGLQGNE